jgi:hypothetical protein
LQNAHTLEGAINDYFDAPTKYIHGKPANNNSASDVWDETVFHTDRAGAHEAVADASITCSSTTTTTHMSPLLPLDLLLTTISLKTAFQIHAADETANGASSTHGAPTRANSPTGYKATSGQETGVIGMDNEGKPYFGPARAGSYDPQQWAMTVNHSTSVAEILQDPDPEHRKRNVDNGAPVLIKPLPSKEPLSGLLAILGTIPLAREALLFRGVTLQDYGNNRTWWSGTTIELPRIAQEGEEELDSSWDVIYETQRLMALVHASNRAYGSVEPLARLNALQEIAGGPADLRTNADRFLWSWSRGAKLIGGDVIPDLLTSKLFLTMVTKSLSGENEADMPFYAIDITLSNPESKETTFYDALDDLVWGEALDSVNHDFCLTGIPPILVIHARNLNTKQKGLGLSVPPTLYLDRYLHENLPAARMMRTKMSDCRAKLKEIEKRREKFKSTKHLGGSEISAEDLFKSAIAFLNPPLRSDDTEEDPEIDSAETAHHKQLASRLAGIYKQIETKVQGTFECLLIQQTFANDFRT